MKSPAGCLAITVIVCLLLAVPLFGLPSAAAHPPRAAAVTPASADRPDLPILQRWSGDLPLAELHRLPDGQRDVRSGHIDDPATFASLWEVLRPGEALPQIDFVRQIVVFSRNTTFYNRLSIGRVMLDHGVAEPLVMETMSALPLEGRAAMALAVVPRAGVLSIKGNASPIAAVRPAGDASPDAGGRFIGEYRLPEGRVAVIAEGDREPRSIGSYSVRVYADLYTGSYVAGTIRHRDGFIREVRVGERDRQGRDEIVVVIETAGSGRYQTTDVFLFDGRDLRLVEKGPRSRQ